MSVEKKLFYHSKWKNFLFIIFCLRTVQSKTTIYKKMGRKKGWRLKSSVQGKRKIFKQLDEGARQVILHY